MHVSIMGASRGVGFQLLTQALEEGHTVTVKVLRKLDGYES